MFQTSWDKFVKAFVDNGGYKNVLLGLENTAYIALFGFLIGLLIGTIIATVKVAGNNNKIAKGFSKVGDVYVGFSAAPLSLFSCCSFIMCFSRS